MLPGLGLPQGTKIAFPVGMMAATGRRLTSGFLTPPAILAPDRLDTLPMP